MKITTSSIIQSVLALLCLRYTLPSLAGSVYKCRNAQGNLAYSGSPCEGKKQQTISSWNAAIDPELPQPQPMILKSQQGGISLLQARSTEIHSIS